MLTMNPLGPSKRNWLWISVVISLIGICAAIALWSIARKSSSIQWRKFSRDEVARQNADGHSVLVSFSADWDISTRMSECLINTPAVRDALKAKSMIAMQADGSKPDRAIADELAALGEKFIPLLVVYPAGNRPPICLEGMVTEQQVVELLKGL